MAEFLSIGETMAAFIPQSMGPLRNVTSFEKRIAGAESNTAVGVNKLGRSAGWISRLGDDEFGHFVAETIESYGVDISGVTFDGGHPTGIMFKEIMSEDSTNVVYYRKGSAASRMGPEDVDEDPIRLAKILHLSGITPILSDSCKIAVDSAIELAKKHGVLVSFDPNLRKKLWGNMDYTGPIRDLCLKADILLMGKGEAEDLFHTSDMEILQAEIIRQHGIKAIAMKDGGNGAWAIDAQKVYRLEPYPCDCVDPVGAGDAFNAGFLFGMLEDFDLEICGRIGAITGALATEVKGDIEGFPSREKLFQLLSQDLKE